MFIINNNVFSGLKHLKYTLFSDVLFYGLVWNLWEPLYSENLKTQNLKTENLKTQNLKTQNLKTQNLENLKPFSNPCIVLQLCILIKEIQNKKIVKHNNL